SSHHPPTVPSAARRVRRNRSGMRARRAVTHGASWRRHPSSQCPIGVPYELLKFAPKKVRGDGIPTEQSGGPIVEMLQSAGQQLRAAENRINQLETQIEHVQD